jgi:hypothetical protein
MAGTRLPGERVRVDLWNRKHLIRNDPYYAAFLKQIDLPPGKSILDCTASFMTGEFYAEQ